MLWVLLSYRLPREPSTPRIALWRRLKKLGALQLGDGLVALPLSDDNREQLDWMAGDVESNGGEAIVWVAEPSSKREQRSLETRLTEASSTEYQRIEEAAAAAARHGPNARRRAVRRLRRTFGEVRARDYFGATERRAAERALTDLAKLEEVRR